MMYLLIDPYIYKQYSAEEIRTLNTVAHIVSENHENLCAQLLVNTIIENYKTGMKARALQLHVQRKLGLAE